MDTARAREIRAPEGRTRGSPARCHRVPYLSWPSSAPKAPVRSSRLGSAGERGAARSGGARWSRKSIGGNRARHHPAVDFEGVAPERHGDARVRASRRRRMRGAAASVVGKRSARHRRPGRAVSGGLERRASRRWRSSLRAYLRKKQLRRAINFLPSLNGATDEGAPRRSRPSRLGRARAARGGETPRARLRARGRFESRAEPRSREDAYRLALRTDTVDYSPPREMERMLRLAFARRNLGRRALDPANHASSPVVPPRRIPTTRSLESPGRASLWRARVPRE